MDNKKYSEQIKDHLSNLHYDLRMECLKFGVLVQATNTHHDSTGFDIGIHEMLVDAVGRLDGLCDRLEKIDMKVRGEQP